MCSLTTCSCACDYPAHNYTYTFEPKPDWSSVYMSAAAIRRYFEDFASKYGLSKYCKTSHEVRHARWKDSEGHWQVEVCDLRTGKTASHECEILINAAGVLNKPQWPNIPGIHEFQGKLIHSAKWDEDVCLKDKRVGLIGNGYVAWKIFSFFPPEKMPTSSSVRQVNRSSKLSSP